MRFGLQKAAGTHQHAERQARLNSLDALFEGLPFDEKAAVGYGTLATVVGQSRPNHVRSRDIMMAGHAYSLGASLMTRNPSDFELVDGMITVITV